jgi:hypothetical protein
MVQPHSCHHLDRDTTLLREAYNLLHSDIPTPTINEDSFNTATSPF